MRALRPHARVSLVVPGQGSQAIGMGKSLHAAYPASRAVFDRVEAALHVPLRKVMFEGPKEQLTRTAFAQPAILTHSVAAFEAFKAEKKETDVKKLGAVAMGHSVGEIVALCIAESITLDDAAKLLKLRGEAMQMAVPSGGSMAALLPATEDVAREVCLLAENETGKICDIANINSLEQVVISGDAAAVARASELSKKRGVRRVIQLDVSAPFHCRLMAPAAEALAKALSSIVIRAPLVPVLSNVTGKPHGSPEQIRAALVEQVTAAVRWHECVLHAREAFQCEEQIEFGPGEVLTSLAKKLKPPLVARSLSEAEHMKTVIL